MQSHVPALCCTMSCSLLVLPKADSCQSTLQAAHSAKAALHRNPGAITIRDVSEDAEEAAAPTTAAEKQMQADADYARQMQAKLDAAQARGGGRCVNQLLHHAAIGSIHRIVFCDLEATAEACGTCSLLE